MRLLNRIALPALIAVLLVFTADSVLGAIAPYPGSKLTIEVNLSDKDFLPVLKQLLSTMPDALPAEIKASVPVPIDRLAADLSGAFAGLKTVRVADYAQQLADSTKVAQHYGEKSGAGKDWKPMAELPGMGLYVKPGPDAMFILVTHPGGYLTVDTTGAIDFVRLTRVATQLIPLVMPTGPQTCPAPSGDPSAVSGVQGTPGGSQGFDNRVGISWEVQGSALVTVLIPDGSGGWKSDGEIASSPKDAPEVPRLIVRSKTGVLSMGGYATYEVRDAEGKAAMRLIVKSRDPKGQAGESPVRIVSFEP